MQSHTVRGHSARDRLVLPAAAIVALGVVSAPPAPWQSAPRLTEVAAVRLQAEVTALVNGVTGTADRPAGVRPAPRAAASPAPAAGRALTYNPSYSWLDNLITNLPDKIRYAVLPPLYVFASVLGAVMGLAYLVVAPIINLINPKANLPMPGAAVRSPGSAAAPGVMSVQRRPGGIAATGKGAPGKSSAKARRSGRVTGATAGSGPARSLARAPRTRATAAADAAPVRATRSTR